MNEHELAIRDIERKLLEVFTETTFSKFELWHFGIKNKLVTHTQYRAARKYYVLLGNWYDKER